MSKTKSMAVKLADALQSLAYAVGSPNGTTAQCAAELRRLDAVEAERDALRVEVEQWRTKLTAVMPAGMKDWHENNPVEWPEVAARVIENQREQYEFMRAEVERLRVDAERYRWLRARPLDDDEIFIAVDSAKHPTRWGLGGSDPDGCDAAIDAARGAA